MDTSSFTKGFHKREGFKGQKMIVLPKRIISQVKTKPFINSIYITDIGYFPKARYHYRERENGSNQFILIYCTEGKGWIELGNTNHYIAPNDYFIIPSGYKHRYGANKKDPWSIYWVHFDGKSLKSNQESSELPFSKPVHFSVEHIQERIEIFNEIYHTLEKGYSLDNIGYANSCLWHLLGSFIYHKTFKNNKYKEIPDPIEESINWMQKHIHKNISLTELASIAHYSVSYYSTLFNQKTGYSPVEYFIHLKIQRACQYLDLTNFKIKEIAQLLGYKDPYYFSRLFNKVMGVFPTEYRKKEKG